MEKVVYILGAGFSAPLGLPVMANFLSKSKDLYSYNIEKYGYFESILKKFADISYIKKFYHADLSNIEEILSILDMGTFIKNSVENKSFKTDIINLICDVIEHNTPEIKSPLTIEDNDVGKLFDTIFGDISMHRKEHHLFSANNLYGIFVSCIQNYRLNVGSSKQDGYGIRTYILNKFIKSPKIKTQYSIITFNYDMVFEKFCEFIQTNYSGPKKHFIYKVQINNEETYSPFLAKLHGSLEKKDIIPPTWNKDVSKSIKEAWKLAHKLLSEANHIRFIGYSLPISDNYFRYLLKSSILESEGLQNIKSIDVICLDTNESVRKRYDEIIGYKNYRFRNQNAEDYLVYIWNKRLFKPENNFLEFDMIEEGHEHFFKKT